MPTYAYKGRNRLNEMVSGEREAATQDELRALLRREQIVMTQASEKRARNRHSETRSQQKGQAERISRFYAPVFRDD